MPVISCFTVDRKKSLQVGQTISCSPPADHNARDAGLPGFFEADEAMQLAHCQFPNGVSRHGSRYLFDWPVICQSSHLENGGAVYTEPTMELIFELVRRVSFPYRPSRLESFFAWNTLEVALSFRQQFGEPDAPIFRVEAADAFCADMSLLRFGSNVMGTLLLAERYWSGWTAPNPNLEMLLTGPVFIAEQVQQ